MTFNFKNLLCHNPCHKSFTQTQDILSDFVYSFGFSQALQHN